MADKKIGTITHFFDKISVGIIKLNGKLKPGDKIRIKGGTTNFEQEYPNQFNTRYSGRKKVRRLVKSK
jgi:hypothetical protein